MSEILVALHDWPASQKVLEAAVQLARDDGRQVAALAVLDCAGESPLDRRAEATATEARRHLEEVLRLATLFARSRGVRLTPYLREGHLAAALVACAEEVGAALLVVDRPTGEALRAGSGETGAISTRLPCVVLIVNG